MYQSYEEFKWLWKGPSTIFQSAEHTMLRETCAKTFDSVEIAPATLAFRGISLSLTYPRTRSFVFLGPFNFLSPEEFNGLHQSMKQLEAFIVLLAPLMLAWIFYGFMLQTFFACFGEFLSMLLSLDELLGNADRWHWAMAVPIVLLLPAVVVIYHSPESPRFLFMEGRHVEAECALEYYQVIEIISSRLFKFKKIDFYLRSIHSNSIIASTSK